jgi:non-haem Fe2+, alpha-ketoglutarate-dependent halogenase
MGGSDRGQQGNGCMWFVPGSHKQELVDHQDTFEEANLLSRGQNITAHVEEADAVAITLQPGEMSLHHGRMFHSSKPNTSRDRRIGLALRYVSPSMSQVSGQRPFAHLVAGSDLYGHFQLLDLPAEVMADGDVEKARQAMAMHAMAMHEETNYEGATEQGKRRSRRSSRRGTSRRSEKLSLRYSPGRLSSAALGLTVRHRSLRPSSGEPFVTCRPTG